MWTAAADGRTVRINCIFAAKKAIGGGSKDQV